LLGIRKLEDDATVRRLDSADGAFDDTKPWRRFAGGEQDFTKRPVFDVVAEGFEAKFSRVEQDFQRPQDALGGVDEPQQFKRRGVLGDRRPQAENRERLYGPIQQRGGAPVGARRARRQQQRFGAARGDRERRDEARWAAADNRDLG